MLPPPSILALRLSCGPCGLRGRLGLHRLQAPALRSAAQPRAPIANSARINTIGPLIVMLSMTKRPAPGKSSPHLVSHSSVRLRVATRPPFPTRSLNARMPAESLCLRRALVDHVGWGGTRSAGSSAAGRWGWSTRPTTLSSIGPSLSRRSISRTVLEGSEAEHFEKRFLAEARSAARLSHPGIVVVHDVGRDEDSGVLFIALELPDRRDPRRPSRGRRLLGLEGSVADRGASGRGPRPRPFSRRHPP